MEAVVDMSRVRMKGWEGQVWREGAATLDGERGVKKSAWSGLEEFDFLTMEGDRGSHCPSQHADRVWDAGGRSVLGY